MVILSTLPWLYLKTWDKGPTQGQEVIMQDRGEVLREGSGKRNQRDRRKEKMVQGDWKQ